MRISTSGSATPTTGAAWSQLAAAREALEDATREAALDSVALAGAREEVLIAEGSDWFWWYGDDHSSDQDLEFDDLFRAHVRNVYQLLQKTPPDELFVSNISGLGAPPAETAPTALLTPTLDGEETSYFEWLGAGALEVRDRGGAMHQIHRPSTILTLVQYGFAPTRESAVRPAGQRPPAGRSPGRRLRLLAEISAAGRRPVRCADGDGPRGRSFLATGARRFWK